MYDVVNNSQEPAIICDSTKKIVWFNKASQVAINQSASLVGKKATLFVQTPFSEKNENKQIITEIGDKKYKVEVTNFDMPNKTTYSLLMFRDVTELSNLKQFLIDDEKLIAYIIVDNLEELLQFEQEKYRDAASEVGAKLRQWSDRVGGIIKEYEKDKYVFVFRRKDLEEFESNNFDILDEIRKIRVGSGNLPVTISIGVAKTTGSLLEKEKVAHVALDMALQRGGDQAAIKDDDGIFFYGGKTNTVHKRTKVRARVEASNLATLMSKSSNVIIMAHKYPDYDAFGASFGMARLAKLCGVKVNIVTDFKNENVKRCLKCIEQDDKGKGTYAGLFVNSSKGLDLVRSRTLLVIVDVNNPAMFESTDIYENVTDIAVIDHHRKAGEFSKSLVLEYIEPSASSASELVSEMLEQSVAPGTVQKIEADMLLAGILLDTNQFTKGTGTKTYAAAMYLRDNGASYDGIQDLFKTNIDVYRQVAKFGQKVEIYRNSMAIAVNYDNSEELDRTLAAKVADALLMVEDVSASFAIMQIDDTIHISARSSGFVNVQLILEKLNGGGRYDAAAAQIKNSTLQNTLLKLKEAIDSYFDSEG